jgi:hypothetical protein
MADDGTEKGMRATTIDPVAFLAGLPIEVREDMQTLDVEIGAAMDGTDTKMFTGTFWGGSTQEIIGYGTYRYRRSDRKMVDWFVVGLARQKDYISVYLSAVEDGQYVAEKYGAGIGKVKVGKSSISFRSVSDIDLDELIALVRKARELSADQLSS